MYILQRIFQSQRRINGKEEEEEEEEKNGRK